MSAIKVKVSDSELGLYFDFEFDRRLSFIQGFSGVDCDILTSYECFEELLATINMLNHLPDLKRSIDNIYIEANNFSSWKKYFEHLVMKVTKSKYYSYSHGKPLRDCYLYDCRNVERCISCTNRFDTCDYRFKNTDKLEGLLTETKYEFFIILGGLII